MLLLIENGPETCGRYLHISLCNLVQVVKLKHTRLTPVPLIPSRARMR